MTEEEELRKSDGWRGLEEGISDQTELYWRRGGNLWTRMTGTYGHRNKVTRWPGGVGPRRWYSKCVLDPYLVQCA